ncbi:Cytochrome c oxidase assembly protein cox11, mitochondrial, variant 2 [Clarireedia jacksonii]
MTDHPENKRIAIVGGGISGISCMWKLRDTDWDIHLYDADSRLGGHANSSKFEGNGYSASVDTGFVVMHEGFYPKFNAFLKALNVGTVPTDMSFGVSADGGSFEWTSVSFMGFIGSFYNIFSLWFWRLVFDIIRFHYCATDIFHEQSGAQECMTATCLSQKHDAKCTHSQKLESIGQYLDRKSYSEQFKKYYLVPMGAAPRCIDPKEFERDFPATTFIRFMYEHELLDTISKTCRWRAFKNGSKTYIDAFLKTLKPNQHIHLETPVASVKRDMNDRVTLLTNDGSTEVFDHVVLAVHANQALQILGDGATPNEKEILRHFKTTRNICYLHSDETLMPRRETAYASWNVLMKSSSYKPLKRVTEKMRIFSKELSMVKKIRDERIEKISITFDMNRLQGIPMPNESGSPGRALVSMNPIHTPRGVRASFVYYHPLFTSDSVLALKRMHLINGVSTVSFAGAWMGHGFHEDGCRAGMAAADDLLKNAEAGKYALLSDNAEVSQEESFKEKRSMKTAACRVMIRGIQILIEISEAYM